ncbi:hypothetical protein KW805_03740 [Candidatus Pacearchaeota archaeon]|nr:hypothetical protein [Candidatus Pacearchaeota archaeon]
MVRILAPYFMGKDKREIEVEKGDLVLWAGEEDLYFDHTLNSFRLGVYLDGGIPPEHPCLRLSARYKLSSFFELGGVSISQMTHTHDNLSIYRLSNMKELYAGQDTIVQRLKAQNGFEMYAALIQTFEKPYLRNNLETRE